MKIKDLINKLKSLPADAQVLVQGYEDGFDDIKDVRQIAASKKTDARDWEGEYESAGANHDSPERNKEAVPAIVIMGNRR